MAGEEAGMLGKKNELLREKLATEQGKEGFFGRLFGG
jgi:hypothetical protein